jgi:hypothetical protein
MKLNDTQVEYFVSKALKLPQGKRKEYLDQVDFLIGRLESKIKQDGSFRVTGFKKTGSLVKGTSLRPRADDGIDADVAVYLDLSEADKSDIQLLHQIILTLVRAVYPQKSQQDFQIQPRTLASDKSLASFARNLGKLRMELPSSLHQKFSICHTFLVPTPSAIASDRPSGAGIAYRT